MLQPRAALPVGVAQLPRAARPTTTERLLGASMPMRAAAIVPASCTAGSDGGRSSCALTPAAGVYMAMTPSMCQVLAHGATAPDSERRVRQDRHEAQGQGGAPCRDRGGASRQSRRGLQLRSWQQQFKLTAVAVVLLHQPQACMAAARCVRPSRTSSLRRRWPWRRPRRHC